MSLVVTHDEKVVCDICHKPITKIMYYGFPGTRFTMRKGIFGKPIHADICDDCILVLIRASEKEGEEK